MKHNIFFIAVIAFLLFVYLKSCSKFKTEPFDICPDYTRDTVLKSDTIVKVNEKVKFIMVSGFDTVTEYKTVIVNDSINQYTKYTCTDSFEMFDTIMAKSLYKHLFKVNIPVKERIVEKIITNEKTINVIKNINNVSIGLAQSIYPYNTSVVVGLNKPKYNVNVTKSLNTNFTQISLTVPIFKF